MKRERPKYQRGIPRIVISHAQDKQKEFESKSKCVIDHQIILGKSKGTFIIRYYKYIKNKVQLFCEEKSQLVIEMDKVKIIVEILKVYGTLLVWFGICFLVVLAWTTGVFHEMPTWSDSFIPFMSFVLFFILPFISICAVLETVGEEDKEHKKPVIGD